LCKFVKSVVAVLEKWFQTTKQGDKETIHQENYKANPK
jgi:hypothetical protein